ncbi:hypothetical protein KAW65_01585 [candidate division WOR-3 bacterium]|nr:hypothetical protein [candidate division WOR-3 bacterium]
MKLTQLTFNKIEITCSPDKSSGKQKRNIIKASSPTTFELKELDTLAKDIFNLYKSKINEKAIKIGLCKSEANAYTYPILCQDKPTLLHFIIYSLTTTGISIELQNEQEAKKFYRIFRDQKEVKEDIEYIMENVKGSLNEIIAALLWQIGAIKVSLGDLKPFFKVDERKNYSPFYIDVKCLSRYNRYNDFIISEAATLISKLDFDIICSIESGGIQFGTLLGEKLNKPSFFTRREKKYKEASLLEIKEHEIYMKKVLLVDDTIVKGWGKERVINELKARGAQVNDCLVIFDRQQKGKETLKSKGVNLHYLTNRDAALSTAIPRLITCLTDEEYAEITNYFKNPKAWHQKKGFPYKELRK